MPLTPTSEEFSPRHNRAVRQFQLRQFQLRRAVRKGRQLIAGTAAQMIIVCLRRLDTLDAGHTFYGNLWKKRVFGMLLGVNSHLEQTNG
jgi:hypothetical protein